MSLRIIPGSRVHLLAARIHGLGPRPLAELFLELAAGADSVNAIERYAALAPLADFIASVGGDRLPKARAVR